MSENNETPDLNSSPTEDKSEVKGPSVKIQPMDGILKNILEQMQKKNVFEEEQDKDYEKLVDQIDNELSDEESESGDESEEMEEDIRWTTFQKLLESHQILCESFSKLLNEEEKD